MIIRPVLLDGAVQRGSLVDGLCVGTAVVVVGCRGIALEGRR